MYILAFSVFLPVESSTWFNSPSGYMYLTTEGGGNVRAYDETKSTSGHTYPCFNLLSIAKLSKSDDNRPDNIHWSTTAAKCLLSFLYAMVNGGRNGLATTSPFR